MGLGIWITLGVLFLICLTGFRVVRPTHRGLIETFGKFTRIANPGLSWIVPLGIQRLVYVNVTEQMVDVVPQMVITKDKLNAEVDAVVYYKVNDVKAAIYNVDDHKTQLTKLSKTTLRAVIGKMSLAQANENRDDINKKIEFVLTRETKSYGVEVLRVEIQRIEPPTDVQHAMNEVVKAEQKKIAANDYATATETEADGERRAAIKSAEGIAKGKTIVADANAYKIKVENLAAQKYFVKNAQKLKAYQVTQASLEHNSKILITEKGIKPNIILGELPIVQKKK